jgi:hypothetical protein
MWQASRFVFLLTVKVEKAAFEIAPFKPVIVQKHRRLREAEWMRRLAIILCRSLFCWTFITFSYRLKGITTRFPGIRR